MSDSQDNSSEASSNEPSNEPNGCEAADQTIDLEEKKEEKEQKVPGLVLIKHAALPAAAKIPMQSKKGIVKKGPGRPRKAPYREVIPRKGVALKPTNIDSYVEFVHDNPSLSKKIIAFFKAAATHNIQFIFRPKEIVMFAKDHHEKSRIRVCIDATKITHYYCKGVLDIGIALKDLEQLLNKVDRDYKALIICSKSISTQKNIKLSCLNEMDIDEEHIIDLIGQYNHMDNEHEFLDENYMIKFEWPNKYFRKTINDIRTLSSQLSISQEERKMPLMLEYVSENKKIHSKYRIKNASKIKLQSNLPDGDTFRIDIKLDYIKSISASHIADDIMIFIDENKKLMTKAYIDKDNAIEIKTVTEIIDIRPDNS